MNTKNIEEICIELDNIEKYHNNKNFNSRWLRDQYETVVESREQGYKTHKNEYRIMKILDSQLRTDIIIGRNLALFVPVAKKIKNILEEIGKIFEREKSARELSNALDKLIDASVDKLLDTSVVDTSVVDTSVNPVVTELLEEFPTN